MPENEIATLAAILAAGVLANPNQGATAVPGEPVNVWRHIYDKLKSEIARGL